jgi:hypothetical protein
MAVVHNQKREWRLPLLAMALTPIAVVSGEPANPGRSSRAEAVGGVGLFHQQGCDQGGGIGGIGAFFQEAAARIAIQFFSLGLFVVFMIVGAHRDPRWVESFKVFEILGFKVLGKEVIK